MIRIEFDNDSITWRSRQFQKVEIENLGDRRYEYSFFEIGRETPSFSVILNGVHMTFGFQKSDGETKQEPTKGYENISSLLGDDVKFEIGEEVWCTVHRELGIIKETFANGRVKVKFEGDAWGHCHFTHLTTRPEAFKGK